jgi:hypothetical protein
MAPEFNSASPVVHPRALMVYASKRQTPCSIAREAKYLPIWQTSLSSQEAKLRPEISFFHSPKWRGHSETEGILKLQ